MNTIEVYEVVKEYEFLVNAPSIGGKVKGKILKQILPCPYKDDVYLWSVSHYYKPSENSITPYHPSRISGDSFVDVERDLFIYVEQFTDIGIEKNERF